jgi:hypothetical protein
MHVRDENLTRYVLGRLSKRRASTIQSHVRSCRACESRLNRAVESIQAKKQAHSGQPTSERAANDKRRQARTATDIPVSTERLSSGPPEDSGIRVLDVSQGGLKLRVPKPIQPGELVQINLKHGLAMCEVRYCTPAGDAFHVGVQFMNVFSTLDGDL